MCLFVILDGSVLQKYSSTASFAQILEECNHIIAGIACVCVLLVCVCVCVVCGVMLFVYLCVV